MSTADKDSDEGKEQELLNKVRRIFHEIDANNEAALTVDFLSYEVHKSPALDKIVSLIFYLALRIPESCDIFARMCDAQTTNETGSKVYNADNLSKFWEVLIKFVHTVFEKAPMEAAVRDETKMEMNVEQQEKVRDDVTRRFRRQTFGNINFIGHLYLIKLISIETINATVFELLETVTTGSLMGGVHPDQDAIACALSLLELTGRRLSEENRNSLYSEGFQMEHAFAILRGAMPIVSEQLGEKIAQLIELRDDDWVMKKDDEGNSGRKEMRKVKVENAHLRGAVADLQKAMAEMRRAMANLEHKNKAVLGLIERQSRRDS